jgi:hypothetical protein
MVYVEAELMGILKEWKILGMKAYMSVDVMVTLMVE